MKGIEMSAPRIWSDAQIQLFTELARSGLPRDDIAERMGQTVERINGLYYYLRRMDRIDCPLTPKKTGGRRIQRSLIGREEEIRAMAVQGMSSRQIARHLGITQSQAQHFMTRNGLYAEARKTSTGYRCQSGTPGVNLARVALPDVCEADVRLARQVWRDFEENAA